MRRVRRIVLNAATVGLAVMCAAAVGLGVRSFRAGDGVSIERIERKAGSVEQRTRAVAVSRGGLLVSSVRARYSAADLARKGIDKGGDGRGVRRVRFVPTAYPKTVGNTGNSRGWAVAGFGWCTIRDEDWTGDGLRGRQVVLPVWAVAVACAIVPAVRAVRWRRRRGRRELCASCGYDLRATPDRCPECGTVAAGR